jgi:squalene-hopene/tetraprenyl-beta-curcumene cyclase
MWKTIAMFVAACGLSIAASGSIKAQTPSASAPGRHPTAQQTRRGDPGWNSRAAATYLDGRMDWWLHWPNAARDHDTTCVSCHTVAPYALARRALRATLGEQGAAPPERVMLAHVAKRVQLWKEIDPYYADQRSGLPKTSESRGTEAILNAVVLASRDREAGTLSEDTRLSFENLWKLQFTAGTLKGAWAWLNFHYEPWESDDGAYYGAALAALAVGTAPGYASSPQIQNNVKLLQDYLQRSADKTSLFNRATALWAASRLPNVLTEAQRDAVIDSVVARQQNDGGWSLASLGAFKRIDGTTNDTASDGYATGLVTLALRNAGKSRAEASALRGLVWLRQHQDPVTGMWRATSLNKQRDSASDVGKFMNDAATAYAVLALAQGSASQSNRDR